jgi:hypothetical protein
VIEEDKWLTDDAAEEADGTVDTVATELEVPETAELESAKLRIFVRLVKIS